MRHLRRRFPFLALLSESPHRASGSDQIILSWDGISASVPITDRVRHSSDLAETDRKYLPIAFQFQIVPFEPVVNFPFQLAELTLICSEYRQIVHITDVMRTASALTDQNIERLERRIREPLRRICSDFDSVLDNAPDKVERSVIFNKMPHPFHDDIRL